MKDRQKIPVSFEGDPKKSHEIVFGSRSELPTLLAGAGIPLGRCLLVTDSNVGPLYAESVCDPLEEAGWKVRTATLPAGESSKSLEGISTLLDAGLAFRLDRRSVVIGLGGGVVGDLAGFAAAILLRGLPVVHIPTSLLAQVDSSIGGKTGINHAEGKNLVGAFHQPSLVLVDESTLGSLPQSELLGGLSEVVKTALLADSSLVDFLAENWERILNRDPVVITQVVRRCAEIKVGIVVNDERESGKRALLNLGHTFGHAIEKVAGFRGVTHGMAVAAGMRAALRLSMLRYPKENFVRAMDLVDRLPLPPTSSTPSVDALVEAMLSDKKRSGETLRFVLVARPGSAVVVDDVSREEIVDGLEFALGPFGEGEE